MTRGNCSAYLIVLALAPIACSKEKPAPALEQQTTAVSMLSPAKPETLDTEEQRTASSEGTPESSSSVQQKPIPPLARGEQCRFAGKLNGTPVKSVKCSASPEHEKPLILKVSASVPYEGALHSLELTSSINKKPGSELYPSVSLSGPKIGVLLATKKVGSLDDPNGMLLGENELRHVELEGHFQSFRRDDPVVVFEGAFTWLNVAPAPATSVQQAAKSSASAPPKRVVIPGEESESEALERLGADVDRQLKR